jgi:AcrR family transcriptional regulator
METTRLTRRDVQAVETRRAILQAARVLFAERGYARTTVKDVAQRAGVSPQTVYDSVGSKRALVLQLNDQIDEEAGVWTIVAEITDESGPAEVLALAPRIVRSIMDNCGDIVRAATTGAPFEAELAAVLAEGSHRHRDGCRRIVRRLESMGALAPGLTVAAATDTLTALTDVGYARLLADQFGWSTRRIERWMLETCSSVLLASPT